MAMQFYVMARTYNRYGGHSTLSLVPNFLIKDADDFGPAILDLTVTFHFPHSGPPRYTLEQSYADFHARLRSLPKIVFRRKREQVAIDIASELFDGKDWEQNRGLSLPLYNAGVAETVEALALLRKRVTAKDDFNLESFLAHCSQAVSRLPSSEAELAAFADECEKQEAARFAAMSPWEKLNVDWRDYHPDAREVLDDPFYWQGANEFAPHSNDTGADLLADYCKWLRRHPLADPIEFYERLVHRWGFPEVPSSDTERTVCDEAAVALAFAELKLRADCRPEVAALAQAAVARQRQSALEAIDWPHRDDRLKSLDMLEAKLPTLGRRGVI